MSSREVELRLKRTEPLFPGIPVECAPSPTAFLSELDYGGSLDLEIEPSRILLDPRGHYQLLKAYAEVAGRSFPELDFVLVKLFTPGFIELPAPLLSERVLLVDDFEGVLSSDLFAEKKLLLVSVDLRRDLREPGTNEIVLSLRNTDRRIEDLRCYFDLVVAAATNELNPKMRGAS